MDFDWLPKFKCHLINQSKMLLEKQGLRNYCCLSACMQVEMGIYLSLLEEWYWHFCYNGVEVPSFMEPIIAMMIMILPF